MVGKLRISGGYLVRRQFLTPPLADVGLVRPATDRVRQAIFSSLSGEVLSAKVLDLFGGSGAYSFESISRGAKSAKIIEKTQETASCIKNNIEMLGLSSQCEVVLEDALRFVKTKDGSYDLIFVDPPYTLQLGAEFFNDLLSFTHKETMIVYRCFKKLETDFGDGYEIMRDRTYGSTRVYFLQRSSP